MAVTAPPPLVALGRTGMDDDPLAPLARAASLGDPKATQELLTALGPSVFGVLQATLGAADPDIDNLAQEVFVAILHALEGFRHESTVLYFARRIAVQRARVALRHRHAARRSSKSTVVQDDIGSVVESSDASPLGVAIARRQMAILRELVAELPEPQAEAFCMRAFGYSVEEIARASETPINTVRSRLPRGEGHAARADRLRSPLRRAERTMNHHACMEDALDRRRVLSAEERRSLEQHLGVCSACVLQLALAESLEAASRAVDADRIARAREGAMARLQPRRSSGRWRLWSTGLLVVALPRERPPSA